MTGTEKNTSSLIACIKPVDSLYDQGSRSACASASVEGESLFAAHGRNRRGRERSILFRNLGFPRPGEHDPHAPGGGCACAAAVAVFTKNLTSLAARGAGIEPRIRPGARLTIETANAAKATIPPPYFQQSRSRVSKWCRSFTLLTLP